MKGDFSNLHFRPSDNFTGTLYQQGRAFSDQDGNTADVIGRHLRQLLGRDTIGPGVAGVPLDQPESLEVLAAQCDGNEVEVQLNPGRVWVDGLHLYVPGDGPLARSVTYLGPPIESPTPQVGEITDGVRDAVVLETWESAFNAFQAPSDLLEPALGGPDTTERVVLNHRLRLLRLSNDEDCSSIRERLEDDLENQGRLSVSAASTQSILGDCPVQIGGGYTGFEHFLYRIEVAEPDAQVARFKYSRFNGGLVGRGIYEVSTNDTGDPVHQLLIKANNQMINLSQLSEFYLEVLSPGPSDDPGHWRVMMSAPATLQEDNTLLLNEDEIEGSWPGLASDEAYFRLWDGISNIGDFINSTELEQGIELSFDPPAPDLGNYRPGDYWTFPVRAAGVDFDPSTWPNNAPPQGVRHHRAPLAILNWDNPVTQLTDYPAIEDCRLVIQPRTRVQRCCRFQVGDGHESFGDFTRIQAAIDHLPPEGGEICVLAGVFQENVIIDKDNVHIHGCGSRTQVIANDTPAAPVFQIRGHNRIRIENLAIQAHDEASGVLVAPGSDDATPLDISLHNLVLQAAEDAAIKVLDARGLSIRDCKVLMLDRASPWQAIFLHAEDALLERNELRVAPTRRQNGTSQRIVAGRGGLHIAGTSESIRVIDNLIQGGMDNGITLGSLEEIEQVKGESPDRPFSKFTGNRLDDIRLPGNIQILFPKAEADQREFRSGGAMYDIHIERNRIVDMGLSGISVAGFFNLELQDEMISVIGLDILGNEITGCLRRALAPIDETMRNFAAYGAVVLGDVESLRCYDNLIEDNGPDHQYPVCGLFVLHGEGIDICRNRILNTGAKSESEDVTPQEGRRGGIVILYALPGIVPLTIGKIAYPRQGGEPAARIHDNIVSQPLGQALFLQALGPVSVQGNQLTSRGLIINAQDPGFWASAVWILNLGMSNEIYFQTFGFTGTTADPFELGTLPEEDDDFMPTPSPGIDDFKVGQYLANGNVLFTNNQVLTDLMELEISVAISSVLILSLDDISIQDNQLDCEFLIDFLFTNLIAAGFTLRINNNRFKESLIFARFSWVGLGLIFNNSADNHSTHCFLNLKSPFGANNPYLKPRIAAHHNHVLYPYKGFPNDKYAKCEWVAEFKDLLLPKGKEAPVTAPPTDKTSPDAQVESGFMFRI